MSTGTFVQLNAFGASDVYLCTRGVPARLCSNNRDSIMYWFIDREDGFATADDIIYIDEVEAEAEDDFTDTCI